MSRSALANLLEGFSQDGRSLFRRYASLIPFRRRNADAPSADVLANLARALLSGRGEASGVALATDLLDFYQRADLEQKRAFFTALATQFNPDDKALERSWERYKADGPAALPALFRAVEAPRQELFRRLNLAAGGTAALVQMRAELLDAIAAGDKTLEIVDADLVYLLQSWFNRGFLTMRPIDWSSPASLLERVIRYEAVHDISSWTELRSRLDPDDRRCFAFFHPAMPEEPLIFVEVGLTNGIPDSIQTILADDREEIAAKDADTAVFYSISNCQPGLKAISFGHFLIKQVANDLKRELPGLTTFVTLSPVPGLMGWLRKTVTDPAGLAMIEHLSSPMASREDAEARQYLMRKAVEYFTEAKNATGRPVDSVSRFHLGNGARLERMNWRADISPNGLRQSGGLMVNYLYDLPRIEEYHEAYASGGEVITGVPFQKMAKSLVGDVKGRAARSA